MIVINIVLFYPYRALDYITWACFCNKHNFTLKHYCCP